MIGSRLENPSLSFPVANHIINKQTLDQDSSLSAFLFSTSFGQPQMYIWYKLGLLPFIISKGV